MARLKRSIIIAICSLLAVSLRADSPALGTNAETNRAEVVARDAANPFGNPIMPGADPQAVVMGTNVWLYPTRGGDRFFAFESADLKHWRRYGPVLEFKDVSWIKDDGQQRHFAWAPGVIEKSNRFYFYYAVGPQNPTPSRIGVATGKFPAGPFKDSGKPLLTGGNGYEAIDPMVFTDPQSGRSYFYAGGSAGSKLRVFELNPDMVSFKNEIPVETPRNFTEGVYMHFRDGVYYLSYSHGSWQSSSYSVHYATGTTPTGPWTYRGVILSSDERYKGPGHHAFFQDPRTNGWLIAYHRWENQTGDGPYHGSRQLCIDRVAYGSHGLILPIVMTGDVGSTMSAHSQN
jgi:beta-xylosidase